MPFKTKRQQRYNALIDSHFMPSEARTLSKVSFATPYMRPLIKQRVKEYDQFIAQGGSEKDFIKSVKQAYIDHNWKHKGESWTATVVFRMLKEAEKEYKYKHRDYESPWEQKRRVRKDFIDKFDTAYEKAGRRAAKMKTPILEYLPEGGARIVGYR